MWGASALYIPARIKEARITRAMSQSDLAEKVSVTKGAISQFENGIVQPKEKVIQRMAEVLSFPLPFFKKPIREAYASNSAVFFRKLKTTPPKYKEASLQIVELIDEMLLGVLRQYIDFQPINLPTDLEYKDSYTMDECEDYALYLRHYWGLSDKPIFNLHDILQENGIIVSQVEFSNTKVDAFSCWHNGNPLIFVDRKKDSSVRRRYSLAHELGHLILHANRSSISNTTYEQTEKEAWWFAAAFMMPQSSFFRDVSSVSLEHLLYLKKRWGVSAAAMIERCYSCSVISDTQREILYRKINYRKWRTSEPYDDICDYDYPYVLRQALELLFENNILSKYEIEDFFCLSRHDIAVWCCAPDELLMPEQEVVEPIKLKLIKS